ncbi:sulfate transporter family protein [Siculibacillus lacustris]|nr:sulfate transporter family protein [Siculibacillus lacustris]
MTGPVLAAIRDALHDLPTPPLRGVLWRSLGLTLAIVAVIWAIGTRLISGFAGDLAGAHPIDVPYFVTIVGWLAGLLSGGVLLVAAAFLIAPITTAVAGIFLDDVAEATERGRYPGEAPGRPMPWRESLGQALRFTGLSLAVNLVCLAVALIPGVGLVAFWVGNGWLIGREYFAFAARRMLDRPAAQRLAAAHSGAAFLAGLAAAAVLSIPIVNLATPLFATVTMVHLVKRLSGSRPVAGTVPQARQ